MSRRPVNPSRRPSDGGGIPFAGLVNSKSRSSPLLTIGLLVVVLFIAISVLCNTPTQSFHWSLFMRIGAIFVVGYLYKGSGGSDDNLAFGSRIDGSASCSSEILRALPVLSKAYGDSMHKVLHVGPDTCSVVSRLLKEEDTEAWGVEPYDVEDVDASCKSLVRKGIVRVADIKFPLPYRAKSFSLIIVSDALDYLSPKYLNKTVPELARVAADGVVIFAGFPGQQRAKVAELSKFGRPAKLRSSSWWIKYFLQNNLEIDEDVAKKFEQTAAKKSYKPACQVFHIKPFN